MDAVLIYNGFPVKLLTKNGAILSSFKYNQNGTVTEFKKGTIEFEFYDKSNFNTEDKKLTKYCKEGYYIKQEFARYKEKKVDIQVLNRDYLFNINDFIRPNIGEIIEVKRLNPVPFNQYYNNTKYTFKLSSVSPIYFKNINDFPVINTDINSEFYSIVENDHVELESKYTGLFYMKNLGNEINDWDSTLFPDENSFDNQVVENLALEGKISKKSYAKLMTLICWKINEVYTEVLPKIAINSLAIIEFSHKEFIIGNYSNSYNDLPESDKIVAEICHQWGVLKYTYPSEIDNFSPVFDAGNPEYAKYLSYYNSLVNFYEVLRFKEESTLFPQFIDGVQVTEEEDSTRRIQYLSEINASALALLPFSERIKLLEKYSTQPEIEEGDQRFVVRIISSFNNSQDANSFLDYIAKVRNGISTNFEIIYHKLDDARLERYAIINWFVDRQTNRKFYIYLLYEMWKISKYNFQYVPLGATNVYEGTNLDGFFLDTSSNGGDKYMPKHNINGELFAGQETFMEFRTISNNTGSDYVYKSTEIKYEPYPDMYKELIFIDEVKTSRTTTINIYSQGPGVYTVEFSNRRLFGQYHLYQPIAIFGYKENLELSIPDTDAIPAFLFFYADDFDQTRDLDAALNFGLEVAIEVALFFLFGGAGAIRHLQYARHLSKLKYIRETASGLELVGISANDAVIVWRATEASAEVITVTAGIMSSLYNYKAQTTTDPDKAAFYKKVCNVFMFMALGTGIGSGLARNKAIKIADDILDNTTPAILNSMNADVLTVLQKLRNRKLNSISNFATDTLQNLNLNNPNLIHNFYNSLPSDNILKDLFYHDFKDLIKKDDFANFLNDTDILNRWQQMADLKIAERVNKDVLSNLNKTNAIIRYYSNASLRNVLEKLTFEKRWEFLDNFGNQSNEWFDYLSNNYNSINRWKNLNASGKIFAKNNPEDWLYIFDRLYVEHKYGERIIDSEILSSFQQRGLDLVNDVEGQALLEFVTASSNKARRKKVLVSGANCQVTNNTVIKTNWKDEELIEIQLNGLSMYQNYINSMFPNLRRKVENVIEFGKNNYNVTSGYNLQRTGKFPGAHAEIRAIDELAKLRFTSPPTDDIFDAWLKNDVLAYNRNIMVNENETKFIMPTCADCFHILNDVTFINNFN